MPLSKMQEKISALERQANAVLKYRRRRQRSAKHLYKELHKIEALLNLQKEELPRVVIAARNAVALSQAIDYEML